MISRDGIGGGIEGISRGELGLRDDINGWNRGWMRDDIKGWNRGWD